MFCGNCGKGIVIGKKFCAACGAAVGEGNKYHMACGTAITPGKKFCRGCGKQIGEVRSPEQELQEENGQGSGGIRLPKTKGKKYTSTVKEKGGVTIPKQVRELLSIVAGDSIVFIVQDGKVLIEVPSK